MGISQFMQKLMWICGQCLVTSLVLAAPNTPLTGLNQTRSGWRSESRSFSNTQLLDMELSQAALDEAWAITEKIQKDFPPTEYIYVALGRSPTLLMAIFEIQKEENPHIITSFLPMSLRGTEGHISGEFMGFLKDYVISQTQFDYAPQKKILLFDFVSSGESLKIVRKLFPEAAILGMGNQNAAEQLKSHRIQFYVVKEGEHSLEEFLNKQITDFYSPYNTIRMVDFFEKYKGRLPRPVVSNASKYILLINYIARRKKLESVFHCRQVFK